MNKPRRWTPEQRARQAQLIRRWQPWKKAGVKTPEGKAISCRNAYKHGAYSYETNLMRRYLSLTRRQLAYCKQWRQRQIQLALAGEQPAHDAEKSNQGEKNLRRNHGGVLYDDPFRGGAERGRDAPFI